MEATHTEDRNKLFQKLKPCCVKISQLAIRETGERGPHRELLNLTNDLLAILNTEIASNPSALDGKLAEYVFFPLHHIFRQLEIYPMPLIENCVKCLTILIVHGWKSKISPKLVQQIFTFLTFIIDGVPGSQRTNDVPEETVLETFRAETALLRVAGTSPIAATGLADPESIPALGHGITVMLDGVADGATSEIQREALRALVAVYGAVKEQAALASFLPGTISSIARILSTSGRYKKLVIADCLGAVRVVLTRVLSDMRTTSILVEKTPSEDVADDSKILSSVWLKATVGQVKVALAIMMKLRTHEALEVREALDKLCVGLLDECHATLTDCTTILVETAMVLDRGSNRDFSAETNLSHLINIYPELGESVKSTVYNWMSSLPRIMQSSDEDVKKTAMYNLSKGLELVKTLNIESSTLDDSISTTLRDSIISLLTSGSGRPSSSTYVLQLHEGTSKTASLRDTQHQPVILAQESQKRLRNEITSLIGTISSLSQHTKIASSMLEYLRESTSLNQIAAFWLCFELVKAAHVSSADVNAFLDLSAFSETLDGTSEVFNDLYAFSVHILDSHTEHESQDWRLEAIALEVVTYAAERSGEAFRPELIDVLFPMATYLGSENSNLQQHAIATLNSVASSCQYANVSELIIDNVDYMVNSVSLRLNTLDISPASTRVLLMMVRLAGPHLIPFLDDIVESIFSALENYHGYPIFVENLFSVLKEVVNQATKADDRLLTKAERTMVNHKKVPPKRKTLESLLDLLKERKERKKRDEAEEEEIEEIFRGHPKTPWTRETVLGKNEEGEEEPSDPPNEEEKPPSSPTFQLLQRVATLTQHYLTSPTPTLRRSLLELLNTASSVLAADEDVFLPLVNAVWPVVIARLYDPEAFVTIEACNALVGLCKGAGDFLTTRFKTEWWDGLGSWCRRVKEKASGSSSSRFTTRATPSTGKDILIPIRSLDGLEVKAKSLQSTQQFSSGGGLGQHASPVRIWDAVAKLLTAIISYVSVEDRMFDEILDLLAEEMEKDPEVREALEVINADAVWFVRYEKGLEEWMPTPQLEGVKFPDMQKFHS